MEVISISASVAQGAHRELAEPSPFALSEMTFPEVSPELPSALAVWDGMMQTVLGEQSQAVLTVTHSNCSVIAVPSAAKALSCCHFV